MTPGHIIHAIHFICTRRPRRPHSALTCCDRLPGRPAQFGSAGRGGNEAHASSPRMGWQRICIPVGPGKVMLSAPGRRGELTREQGSVARAVGRKRRCPYREGHLVRMLREEGWRLPSPAGSQGHPQSEADATGAVL